MYFMKMDLSSYRTIIHRKYQIKKIADHISTSKSLKAMGNLSFPFLKFTVSTPCRYQNNKYRRPTKLKHSLTTFKPQKQMKALGKLI